MNFVWLGGELSFQLYQEALRKLEEYQLKNADALPAQLRERLEEEDDPFNGFGDMVTMNGDIAVVQVAGMLVSTGWGPIGRYFGIVGYDEIRNALVEIANSGLAKSVLLDVRSSGGSASGIGELSDFMANFKKIMRVDSYTGVEALSAGQWILAFGEKVYAGKMASVGSIGVISVYMDVSERLKRDGVKPVVIRSGSQKALGNGLEPITDDIKKLLQERSDRYHDFFKDHMGEARNLSGKALDDITQGQVLFALDAVPSLVDAIKSFDEVVIEINARHTSAQTAVTGDYKVKRQLNAAGLAAVDAGMAMEEALKDPKLSEVVADDDAAGDAPAGEAAGAAAGDAPAPDAAAGDAPAGDAPAAAAGDAPAAATGDSAALLGRMETLMTEKVEQGIKLKAKETEVATLGEQVTALQADLASLRSIVSASITGMQTAMSLPLSTETLKTMPVADLVTMHANLRADMGKKYPVGGVGQRGKGGAQAPQQHGMVVALQGGHSKLSVNK